MSRVIFILSGSIACYKACDVISRLVQRGHTVRAVVTEAALKFVGTATLEGLTREPVGTDLFDPGAALDHIAWARWAEVVIVCPATANTLNRMAAGLGDDLAGALWLARDSGCPWLVAPAMNPAMWSHPATQVSVERLQAWGVRFISPDNGRTACGEAGTGRLAAPEAIVAAVESAASAIAGPGRSRRVLITSGATSEPIDGVRVITNSSTGATGALIAERLDLAGHGVVLLRARSAVRPILRRGREEMFFSFADLDEALERELKATEFDVIVHAAAVSDFNVSAVEVAGVTWESGSGKLRSTDASPVVRLRRNPKLLDKLRERSRSSHVGVVAFKLTNGASPQEAREAVDGVFASGVADLVVYNDLATRVDGAGFPAEIWARDRSIVARCADRESLAQALATVVERWGVAGGPVGHQ